MCESSDASPSTDRKIPEEKAALPRACAEEHRKRKHRPANEDARANA